MTTGRLAIGAFMLGDQNWLLSAVNRSGAVSPLMRATASRIPVRMPVLAARYVIDVIIFHIGHPRATAASRRLPGTSLSISSVVRTTTGTTSSPRATEPAQPEKCPAFATYTE